MAAPADAAAAAGAWQPPTPGPGELERAFAPLGPSGQAVLRAIDAYPLAAENGELVRAIVNHIQLEADHDNVVPYQWQVGRFLRHALDRGNTDALAQVAFAVSGASTHKGVILMCVQWSLHPDKATAVQLFKDVVAAHSSSVVQWTSFLPDLTERIAYQVWGKVRHPIGGLVRDMNWTEWTQEQECLAKVEKCLAIGSPLQLQFDYLQTIHIRALTFSLLRTYVQAFIQHDRGVYQRSTAYQFKLAVAWHVAHNRHAYDFDATACATLVRHVDQFVELRWPARTTQVASANAAQTGVIQLLANHLARSQIGDPHVIPNIMDFVRLVPGDYSNEQLRYQQAERQEARTAVARGHIARAQAQVASAPASATNATPVASRAREGEDEAGAAAAAAPSKRRA